MKFTFIVILIAIISLVIYRLYINSLPEDYWFDWYKYSKQERKHYESMTMDNWQLIECILYYYQRSHGKKLDNLNVLVEDGYLRTIPPEYYTSRNGNNHISTGNSNETILGGWSVYYDDSHRIRFIRPNLANYDDRLVLCEVCEGEEVKEEYRHNKYVLKLP